MNQLSTREKVMLGIGALGIIVALFYFGVPWIRVQIGGGEVAQANQEELDRITAILDLRIAAELIEDHLREQSGLRGNRVISDDLLNQIKEKANTATDPEQAEFVNLNKASLKDLYSLGLDKEQANAVRRYRQLKGGFESVDDLSQIHDGLFEGQDEQAVILEHLANIAKESGIEQKNITQLEPRLTRSTKAQPLSPASRSEIVTQLFLYELSQEAEATQHEIDAEGDASPAVAKNRWFSSLPDAIPPEWRLKLIEIMQKRQGDLGVEVTEKEAAKFDDALSQSLAGLNADVDEVEIETLDKGRRGLLGLWHRPVKLRVVHQDADEGLVTFFQGMQSEGEADIDRASLDSALSDYVVDYAKARARLDQLLKMVPMMYQRQAYIVDMAFKGEMEKLVPLIEKLELSRKWLKVRGLKLSIADDKKTVLQANLTMIATIL